MSPMIELILALSVIIHGENSQKMLLIRDNGRRQCP